MRVVFVQAEFESLAVGIFSNLLKQHGHEPFLVYDTRLFNTMEIQNKFLFGLFDIRDKLAEETEYLRPDLVAFSVLTDQYLWAKDMAARIKKRLPKVPVIFGGLHVTMMPEEVISNECIDIVCVGEGEGAVLELAESISSLTPRYDIQNLWFKKDGKIIKNNIRPLIEDLDTLPFPDKQLFYDKQPSITGHYGLLSGRGCPFKCTFCASDVVNRISSSGRKYLRRRSPRNVVNELLHARATLDFKIKTVSFFDDTFTYDIDWLKEFAKIYKDEVALPFHCTGYPNTVTHEKAALLKDAGCYRIGIGVQSVSEKIRRDILDRPGTNEQIRQAAKACKDTGLNFWFDHILNIPYETQEDELDALKFYNEIRPDIINIFWLIYYPRARIVDIAKDAGILDDDTINKINKGEATTAMVIGVGGEYSFAKERVFANFAFLLHLLPLIPKSWMDKIIEKRMFMSERFKPPLLLNVFIKLLVRMKLGQASETTWFVVITFKRMYENICVKLFNRNINILKKKQVDKKTRW